MPRTGTSLFQTRTNLEVVATDVDSVDPSLDFAAAHVPFENMGAFRTSHIAAPSVRANSLRSQGIGSARVLAELCGLRLAAWLGARCASNGHEREPTVSPEKYAPTKTDRPFHLPHRHRRLRGRTSNALERAGRRETVRVVVDRPYRVPGDALERAGARDRARNARPAPTPVCAARCPHCQDARR